MSNRFLNCSHILKSIKILSVIILSCAFLTACGGPSEEKITTAQNTFTQLVDIHNQVVEAHKHISDNTLDDGLTALAKKVIQIEEFNLNEMKDEDIDLLVETMNSIISSYDEYLTAIEQIENNETAAVITTIPLSLTNSTDLTFQKLVLHEKNNNSQKSDVLESSSGFAPKQSLAGLAIYRDTDCTPWVLELQDADGTSYEIELSVENFDEVGNSLTLQYDSETNDLKCS